MHPGTETTASAVMHGETPRAILNTAHRNQHLPRGQLLAEEFGNGGRGFGLTVFARRRRPVR
jgi:hypothetical protein